MSLREEVQATLYGGLSRLVHNRVGASRYEDEGDIGDRRYYFSTLEGLEALLIPLANLPKLQFWEPLLRAYPELKASITDDITFVLRFNPPQDQPPPDQGRPYFRRLGKGGSPYWTSECCSFTISVLANYLKLKRRFNLPPKPSNRAVIRVVDTQLRWLKKCSRGESGWAWVFDGDAHPWPTWSLLDTFEEVLNSKDLLKYAQNENLERVVARALADLSDTASGTLGHAWLERVVNSDQATYDAVTALDVVRLMLAITLHRHARDLFPLAKTLFQWASSAPFDEVAYSYHLEPRQDYIQDSSLLPSVLRTLTMMAGALQPRQLDDLDTELGFDHKTVIFRTYRLLNQTRVTDGPYAGLWGVRNAEHLQYELYYSERTLEALTDLHMYLRHRRADFANGETGSKDDAPMDPTPGPAALPPLVRKGETRHSPPNDIDRYTSWIPVLGKREKPEYLAALRDWPAEDLLEFYLFRLFNLAFVLDGSQWGYRTRGEELPDGILELPTSRRHVLYDAKSSDGPFGFDRDEYRKFVAYANAGKRRASAANAEIGSFLVLAVDFAGNVATRRQDFVAETGLPLACIRLEDLCDFADRVREHSEHPTKLQAIPWERLLTRGNPLVDKDVFKEALDEWKRDIRLSTLDEK